MRKLLFILGLFISLNVSATDFVVGSGSGSISKTSMSGLSQGDRLLIADGAYTSFTFSNLINITIIAQSGRPTFSSTCTFVNNKGVSLGYISLVNITGVGINMSSGSNSNCTLHHIFFNNITSSVISAHNNIQYDYVDTATAIIYKMTIDSVKSDSCGQFMQGSFGDPNSGGTTAPDVFIQLNVTRLEELATRLTTPSDGQGTGIRGICYHCSADQIWVTDRSGRGASGDVGWFYGSGAWHINRFYKWGGPGYVIRMNGPMSERADAYDNWITNSGKFGGTQYGFANYQFNGGDTITGKTYGPSTRGYSNSYGNQFNDTLGYWSTMANFGQIPPGANYFWKNNLAFNVGNNIQRVAAGGQPNNAKNQMAANLGGWNTIATDTSNNKYFYSATLANLDTTTVAYTNRLGTFYYYKPTALTPSTVLNAGTTNPISSVDYVGYALKNPPDLGYLQYQTATTALTFTPLSTYFLAPGAGPQNWGNHAWNDITQPTVPAGNTVAKNYYQRFNWRDFESSTVQGSYTWTTFDNQVNAAIDAGAQFYFGVMIMCAECGTGGEIPTYVHNLMQAETIKDWFYSAGGWWVPNWNSVALMNRYNALLRAMTAHIAATSHSGKSYTQAINGFDFRYYGEFGEGHTFPWQGTEPANTRITEARYNAWCDSMIAIFPDVQLTAPLEYFAPINSTYGATNMVTTGAAYHLLTATNNVGRIGWRRDNVGDDGYNVAITGISASYNPGTGSVPLKPLMMDMWKYAPIGGEPSVSASGVSRCGTPYCDLHNEDTLFHYNYLGNGNFPYSNSSGANWTNQVANVRAGYAEMGYKLAPESGSITASPVTNGAFQVNLNWKNTGLTPTYESWTAILEMRTSGGTVVWRDTSDFNPRLFLPATTATTITDTKPLTSVSPGTYNLHLIIKDPNSYKLPLPLTITGRQSDGSYILKSGVVVSATSTPAANAGADQTIVLPTTTITLDGTGSSGTITSYLWTRVSGPNTPSIISASSVTTSVTGLIAGTYVFQLSVNGGTSTDQVTIQVNTAPPPAGTIFTSQTPAGALGNDGVGGIEVGVKFRSTASGVVTGVRFYKQTGNSGTHTGELYSSTGTRLAQIDFTGETTSGWQTMSFSSPVSIAANTTYIAAIYSSLGNYSFTGFGLTSAITNAPLTALADGTDGLNGLYRYTNTPAVPNAGFQSTNYWVDVNFAANLLPTPVITGSGSVQLPTSSVALSGTSSTDTDGTITGYSWTLVSGPNAPTIGTPTASTSTITGLVAGTYVFRLTVTDNLGGVNSVDKTVVVLPQVATSIIVHKRGGRVHFR